MPVCDMHFRDGIFFARQQGYISPEDARQWAESLARHARSSQAPIVALVDARDVTSISEGARRILAYAAATPNVRVASMALSSPLAAQQARMIALLSSARHTHQTHLFSSMEEAEAFAVRYLPAYGR